MQAAVYRKEERGKVLRIEDVPAPAPKENEVLLKVHAASVNPLDWRMKKRRPGMDVAGEVVAAGSKVTQFKPGDAVFGTCLGSFAEYACAAEKALANKPANLSFAEAAAIPVAGLTALQGLRDIGKLQAGEKILINGGAGGVGTFAVQIAKAIGADVTAVCSTRNVDMVRELGASCVIDYTQEDFTKSEQKFDVVLDNVGNVPLAAIRRVMTRRGRCPMAGAPKTVPKVLRRLVEAFGRSVLLRHKFMFFIARIRQQDLAALCELIKAGKLKPMIDRCYPLSQAADALAYVEQGHARAKVVVRILDE